MRLVLLVPCLAVLCSATAMAQDCDIAAEVTAIAPIFQARIQELSANPTPENMETIQDLSERFSEAGSLAGTDRSAACAQYAKLRQMLEM